MLYAEVVNHVKGKRVETNVGVLDGWARLIAGILLLQLSYGEFGTVPLLLAWPVWILGAIVVLTGLFHHCFIYKIFEMSSCAYGPSVNEE